MKDVYQLVHTTLEHERRMLDKFMRSPLYVTHREVRRLYILIRDWPAGSPPHRKALAAALFPNDSEADKKYYHVSHYLKNNLEEFWAWKYRSAEEMDKRLAALKLLRRWKAGEAAEIFLRSATRLLEAEQSRGSIYFRQAYEVKLEAFYSSSQQGRAKEFHLAELSQAQDVAFILEKLRTGCLLLSQKAVSDRTYKSELLENLLCTLENGHFSLQIPIVAAYYHGYCALANQDNHQHFPELKRLLETCGNTFPTAEIHDLYLLAINFCIRKINQGEAAFSREIFELYQSALHHGALLEDGVLSRWSFNNITITAIRLGEYHWTAQFLEHYAGFLPESHREATLNFNKGRYFYALGNYRKAVEHLQKMEYDDVLQNLTAKVLLAKIFYEEDEWEVLESHLDSMRIYLLRQKILGYHKTGYLQTIKFMRKLLNLNLHDNAALSAFRNAVQQSTGLPEKEWFLKCLAPTATENPPSSIP